MGAVLAVTPAHSANRQPEEGAALVRAFEAVIDPAAGAPMADPIFNTASEAESIKRLPQLAPIGPYFPARAAELGVGGVVVVACKATDKGRLSSCRTLFEAPKDYAFEEATAAMARRGYLTVAPGEARSRDVRIVVQFPKPFRR